MAYMNGGSALGAPLADYGTFNGWVGLAAPKKKKKRGFFRKVGRVAKKVGKVALKAAPIVAGLTLGPAGGVVVGAASGAIGRGRPKLKRILRGAAYGGAAGLVRTGQAGRILVKGAKAAARLAKAGGRIVSKIPKEVVGGGVIGAGGGAIVDVIQKRRKRQMPDEPLTPEESGPIIDTSTPQQECEARGGIWTRSGCVMTGPPPRPLPPDLTTNGGGEGPTPQAAPSPGEAPPSPTETPTSGQLPVAGGLIPGPAVGAVLPGTGGEQFAPTTQEDVVEPAKPNTALLVAAGIAVVVLVAGGGKKSRRRR